MADDSKLRDLIDRGERSRFVLNELEEAFSELEKQCFETFRKSDLHDDTGRRAVRYYLRVMDDIRERFQAAIIKGENAHKELIRLKEPSTLRKMING